MAFDESWASQTLMAIHQRPFAHTINKFVIVKNIVDAGESGGGGRAGCSAAAAANCYDWHVHVYIHRLCACEQDYVRARVGPLGFVEQLWLGRPSHRSLSLTGRPGKAGCMNTRATSGSVLFGAPSRRDVKWAKLARLSRADIFSCQSLVYLYGLLTRRNIKFQLNLKIKLMRMDEQNDKILNRRSYCSTYPKQERVSQCGCPSLMVNKEASSFWSINTPTPSSTVMNFSFFSFFKCL